MIRFQWGKKCDPVFKEAASLRIRVFMEEQNFSYDLDELDEVADHLGLYNEAGEIIGAARVLYPENQDAKAGRICVRSDLRGKGIGRLIMEEIEHHCRLIGMKRILLGGQKRAEGFYRSLGYAPCGEPYDEEGCPHIPMVKWLQTEGKEEKFMKAYKKIGIIGAMQIETDAVLPYLSETHTFQYAGISFIEGILGETTVVLATSGIGKVQAACTAQLLIDRFGVQCIINTGIAGGLAPSLKTCDVVIANALVYHDYSTPEPDLTLYIPEPSLVETINEICSTVLDLPNTHFFIGKIATGDQFVHSASERERILSLCNPLCVEMEGAAIGHCCTLNGVDFAVIRAISDSADENAEDSFERLKITTAHIAAIVVTELIGRIQQ